MKQNFHDKMEEINADFNKIQEDYDSKLKEVENKGHQHLQQLKEASNDLHLILPDIKEMLEKTEKDLGFEVIYTDRVLKKKVHDCVACHTIEFQ